MKKRLPLKSSGIEKCLRYHETLRNNRMSMSFGGYFWLPRAYAAFRRLRSKPCQRVWITEAFNYYGISGWLRLQRARWLVRREARAGFSRVFAMGELGVNFFRRAGIRPGQLCEFAYLVEPPPLQEPPMEGQAKSRDFRFCFVGQMVRRKGGDCLLRAAARLPAGSWSMELVGDGTERRQWEALAAEAGLADRVHFLGNQSNPATLRTIRSADALVLPSRWDGWGAVVNESLMAGTPAIVSDACGAASLIVNDACGKVFKRADDSSLREALQGVLATGKIQPVRRRHLSDWSAQTLGGPQLADYFLNCLASAGHNQTVPPPWRKEPFI